MTKEITIDATNSTIRIPAKFINRFRRSKQHRKIKALLSYDEYNKDGKEVIITVVEASVK